MSGGNMPVATDPLGAIRVQLVGAARRRSAGRRRRQRATVAVLAIVVALAALAGAAFAATSIAFVLPALAVKGLPGALAPADLAKPHGEGVGEAREGRGA